MTIQGDVTTFLSSVLISNVQDIVVDRVINKWRDYRATKFFDILIREVSKENSANKSVSEVDEILNRLLSNSRAEEILFESYRKVCLSTTKDIGPKIIGLLTAKILLEERIATEEEESIFMLAEEMRDIEFIEFCKFYEKENLEENLLKSSYDYSVNVKSLGFSDHFTGTPTSHLTPIMALGKWAGKLEKVGLLYTDTLSENYMRPDDSNKDVPVIAYHFSIIFKQSNSELYKYVRRAQGPADKYE